MRRDLFTKRFKMDLLLDVVRRLRQLREEIPQMIVEVLEDNRTLIEDLNIAQLQRGERVDGSIQDDYSPTSVFKYGKPPGPIRLFDTGAFYRGVTLEIFTRSFQMIGRDIKTDFLERGRFGEVVGLTEDTKFEVIETILTPGLQDKTRNRLLNE